MNQEKIGKFIGKLRKEKNLTQEELANILGVTNKTISRWETGKYMPDLSLFTPLSEELEVSVNDLMNGEIVDKKEYQEIFEKNIVNTISKVDKNNKYWNMLCNTFIGIGILFILWFVSYVFYINFTFVQEYDAKNMVIEKQADDDLTFRTSLNGSINYLITTYTENDKEVGLIFIIFKKTLENYYYESSNQSLTGNIDLTNNLHTGYGIILNNSNIPNNYRVYYSTISFKKIAKANNEELIEIINNSNLMYESEDN